MGFPTFEQLAEQLTAAMVSDQGAVPKLEQRRFYQLALDALKEDQKRNPDCDPRVWTEEMVEAAVMGDESGEMPDWMVSWPNLDKMLNDFLS